MYSCDFGQQQNPWHLYVSLLNVRKIQKKNLEMYIDRLFEDDMKGLIPEASGTMTPHVRISRGRNNMI